MPPPSFLRFSRSELGLVGVTMAWGLTFVVIRLALSATGPLFFVGTRFAVSVGIIALLSRRVLRGMTAHELFAGALIGVSIFAGYVLQTWGMQFITASKSAFITAFYVPAVPILQWLVMKKPPHYMAWLGILAAFAGLALMAGPDGVSTGFGKGETATLFSALAFAAEILLIGRFAGNVDVRRVTIVQLAVASALAFAAMPLAGESVPVFSWLLAGCVCGLGLASAVIQSVMNWAQRSVTPTRATVIYAGEPVWAGIFGRMAGERLPPAAIIGGALIVLGVLISELRPGRKRKK